MWQEKYFTEVYLVLLIRFYSFVLQSMLKNGLKVQIHCLRRKNKVPLQSRLIILLRSLDQAAGLSSWSWINTERSIEKEIKRKKDKMKVKKKQDYDL